MSLVIPRPIFDTPMTDEVTLLQAAKNFDRDALKVIFDTYAPILYNYALRLTQDRMDADNVVGDVFALLLDQLAEGKGPRTNLRSYLYQTAYHVIVDGSRNRRRLATLDASSGFMKNSDPVADDVEDQALLKTLIDAMNSVLSPDQQHVLVLRFTEGFSLADTAKIMKKTVNNIKVIESRGLRKLRDALNRNAEEEK